jgi:hypothetical protein
LLLTKFASEPTDEEEPIVTAGPSSAATTNPSGQKTMTFIPKVILKRGRFDANYQAVNDAMHSKVLPSHGGSAINFTVADLDLLKKVMKLKAETMKFMLGTVNYEAWVETWMPRIIMGVLKNEGEVFECAI